MDRIFFSIQRLRKGHLIILLLRQTKDSRKKPRLQHKLLVPGKNQNQDNESSRQPGTSPTAGAPSQVRTVAPDDQRREIPLLIHSRRRFWTRLGSSRPPWLSEYRTKLVLKMNGWMERFWTFILPDFKRIFIGKHWSKVKNNLTFIQYLESQDNYEGQTCKNKQKKKGC